LTGPILGRDRVKTVRDRERGLSLRFLGRPRVEVDGRPAAFATRKTLALLAYLVLERGSHPRERVTALLWPDSDAAHGRAALRTTLAYLRSALGDQAARLRADRSTLELDPAGAWLDLDHLDAAPSGPFLDGLSIDGAPDFEEWLTLQRERWRRRVAGALARAARLPGGDVWAAVDEAERRLALDPLDDVSLRRLMEAYLAADDPDGAWHAYAAGRARLARDLGVEPGPETVALAERARATAPGTRGRTIPAGGLARIEAAFVGRSVEHRRLIAALEAARASGPRVAVVEGEAGIGKTRLCLEFLRAAEARGADLLRGRAAGASVEGRLPYEPVVEALRRRIERENAPDDLLADVWLAELARLLPELLDRYPDLPRPPADDAARGRLFEAVVRLVHTLAQRAPVVLFLDDLQWADAASLDLVLYAAGRWVELGTPILLLGTLRDEAGPTWLSDLERAVRVERLELGPLSAEDVLAWLGVGRGQDAFGRWLYAETGGQPFFASETLKMLIEAGVLVERTEPSGPTVVDFDAALARETELRGILPPRVREVVRARLARLSEPAFGLLAAAAALGPDATFEAIARVSDLAQEEALTALDTLRDGRWLLEDAARGQAAYAFGHDKVREAVYAELGQARRRVLHRRALDVLRDAGAPPARLAAHARAAGLDRALVGYALDAGEAALAVFATGEAIGQLEAARSLGELVPEAQLRPLYGQLGRAYELAGEAPMAGQVYRELLDVARARGLASAECLALNRLATLSAQANLDVSGALVLLGDALRAADRSGDLADRAETAWSLAQVNYYGRDLSAARAHAERALALARQLGVADLLVRCLNVSAYVLCDLGEATAAQARAEEARGLYKQLRNRVLEVDCLCILASLALIQGQRADATDRARLAVGMSDEVGNAWGRVFSRYNLALALLEGGAVEEALRLLHEALAIGEHGASPLVLRLCRNALGAAERALGRLDDALVTHLANTPALPAGARPEEVRPADLFDGVSVGELCADYALLGRWDEAAAFARMMLSAAPLVPAYARLRTLWHEVAALARAGQPGAARQTLSAFVALAGDSPRYRVARLRAEAALAAPSEAAVLLEEAGALAQRLDLPIERREIELALRDESI
jgi:DNA-binding SARP family transcriptional activator